MKSVPCQTCRGTGKVIEVSTNARGIAETSCWACGGLGYSLVPDNGPSRPVTDPDNPEPLGIWIFLIAAGLAMAQLGVMIGLGPSMTALPIWYYPIAVGVPGLIAWRFTELVANLTFLVVGVVIVFLVLTFIVSHFI